MNARKITVNGQMYIAEVNEENGVVTLTKAMAIDNVNRSTIVKYLERKQLQELETVEFTGMGTAVSKSDFSDEEEMMFKICKTAMKYAEKKAAAGMVNATFREALGKF